MAKNMQPYLKRCRTLGISPAVMGVNKESNRNPGPQRRPKKSEYALQLTEKQKVKFVYGVLEKQFRAYYEKAARMKGNTGDELMTLLERRLDNVVFRLGLAATRREARQLVNHGHFTVNGKRVNIPSYLVKEGEVIAVCDKSRSSAKFKKMVEDDRFVAAPKWLEKNKNAPLEGKVIAMPQRDDIDFDVAVNLIVELYSK
ncbi:MAG: 30S ribosomal protein S4 [Oscillospiraceae bacterium]|jgi:small subunit ribosomal protein S4|nr:30S ribosomal protein S4 [Oscillospiraceae bacterium]MCI9550672.1 30S ribosomal protein S4 [Oscillospiraceae bacterium]